MKTAIYSTDSEPYFMEVDDSQLATALNSVGWQLCPEKPSHDEATQHPPVWGEGVWVVRDKSEEEIATEYTAAYPPAENYQVRAWMIRGGLDPDAVPAIITAVVPESVPGGINRAEALMRWDYAVRVPRNFPLVNVIGENMNLTPEQIDSAWSDILKL